MSIMAGARPEIAGRRCHATDFVEVLALTAGRDRREARSATATLAGLTVAQLPCFPPRPAREGRGVSRQIAAHGDNLRWY